MLTNLISTICARRMLQKGYARLLAWVKEVKQEKLKLEEIPIVNKLFDVFPEELPNLPPEHEVEFSIDLLSGIESTFMPPYKMALT